MDALTSTQRRALRAKAHHLDPVVIIGQHGLTPAVAAEIDLALAKHELIKVRVFSDAREDREALLATICADMDCAAVQHLGKVLVVWRPNPEVKKPAPIKREPKAATKSGAKRPKAPKSGPRTPVDPIRERRRGTQADAPQIGKGTRGAARFNALPEGAPLPPRGAPLPLRGAASPPRRTRTTEDAPVGKRKSSWTAKTTPRSFSAKPNPREAWAKKPPAGSGKSAESTLRRRRKT
ncbi:MAG: ribosome assembly RNA-binding protein YhbY [Betaproteobacteria bacterium]